MVPCFYFDRWAPKMTVRTQTIAFYKKSPTMKVKERSRRSKGGDSDEHFNIKPKP